MQQNSIGSFIAALRKANGLTQRELAERLSVSDKSVSRWERGDGLPDLALIPVIAEVFGITCDELLAGKRTPSEPRSEAQTDERNTAPNSNRTEQQVGRLLSSATLMRTIMTVIAMLIACTTPAIYLLTTAVANNWQIGSLIGYCVLLISVAVLWIGLALYHQKTDTSIITQDQKMNRWASYFPLLSAYCVIVIALVIFLIPHDVCFLLYSYIYHSFGNIDITLDPTVIAFYSIPFSIGLILPLIRRLMVSRNLLPPTPPTERHRTRTARILSFLLTLLVVAQLFVVFTPINYFVQTEHYNTLVELQARLDEKMPIFTIDQQKENFTAQRSNAVFDSDGTRYPYVHWINDDHIFFHGRNVFPASVLSGVDIDTALARQELALTVISYSYPTVVILCMVYFIARRKKV